MPSRGSTVSCIQSTCHSSKINPPWVLSRLLLGLTWVGMQLPPHLLLYSWILRGRTCWVGCFLGWGCWRRLAGKHNWRWQYIHIFFSIRTHADQIFKSCHNKNCNIEDKSSSPSTCSGRRSSSGIIVIIFVTPTATLSQPSIFFTLFSIPPLALFAPKSWRLPTQLLPPSGSHPRPPWASRGPHTNKHKSILLFEDPPQWDAFSSPKEM